MTDLFENERIDDLEINDLRLIQNAEGYCFTSDSVLLANIVKARKTDKILDVGAGSGIISILLAGKMGYGNVSALEIQKNMAALAARNVEMNGLSDKIVVINLGEFIINSFLLFDVLNIQKNYIRDYNKKNKRAIYFY